VFKVVSNNQIYTVERLLKLLCLLEFYAEELNPKEDNFDVNKPLRQSTRDAAATANVKIKSIIYNNRDISENHDCV